MINFITLGLLVFFLAIFAVVKIQEKPSSVEHPNVGENSKISNITDQANTKADNQINDYPPCFSSLDSLQSWSFKDTLFSISYRIR